MVYVNWFEAAAYCAWAGGRLPSEIEWECAARGGSPGVRYPWGDEAPDKYHANFTEDGPGHPTPVGLYPEGATPGGIQDLAGNRSEWVGDWWRDNYEKLATAGEGRVARSGAWGGSYRSLRVSFRSRIPPGARNDVLGFRCVRELPTA